jgi:hypothetical protein
MFIYREDTPLLGIRHRALRAMWRRNHTLHVCNALAAAFIGAWVLSLWLPSSIAALTAIVVLVVRGWWWLRHLGEQGYRHARL